MKPEIEALKFLRDLILENDMAPSPADDAWDQWNKVLDLIVEAQ